MPERQNRSGTDELAESALFLYRNFSKTQMALALAATYRSVGRQLPLNSMREWEGLGPYDLLSITNPIVVPNTEVTNGDS